jgi:uncharacterized membrane protein YdjX (TVP38/TMEM64 family)
MTPTEKLANEDPSSGANAEDLVLSEEARRSWKKEKTRIIQLALGLSTFMLLAHLTPLQAWITNVQLWKSYIRDLGWLAHAGFGLLGAFAVMAGIPRLSICAAAGLLFGFAEGLALSLMGSVAGAYGAFVITRQRGGGFFLKERDHVWPWLKKTIQRPTLAKVFWIRQLMLPGIVLNVLLGLSSVKHRTFLAGTLLGYLPLNMASCLMGSGIGKDSFSKTLTQLLAASAIIHIIGWAGWGRRCSRNETNHR